MEQKIKLIAVIMKKYSYPDHSWICELTSEFNSCWWFLCNFWPWNKVMMRHFMSFIFLADVKAVYVAFRTHNSKALVKTQGLCNPWRKPVWQVQTPCRLAQSLHLSLGPAQAVDKDRVDAPGLSGASESGSFGRLLSVNDYSPHSTRV